MEQANMGRILTEATIENLEDLWVVKQGRLSPDQVRRVTVSTALVDTGTTALSLPTHLIQQLGLTKRYEKQATSARGLATINVYDAVRLTIMGRDMTIDPSEVPDVVPVLVGQIPLEYLDFVPDPRTGKLVGNPAHGGEQIFEMY